MKEVLIAIGSNHLARKHIKQAKELLLLTFGREIVFSSVIKTKAVDIQSPDFLNCVAYFHTDDTYEKVRKQLKQMETVCEDTRQKRMRNIVEMDLDILSYDGLRHHQKDWNRDYIHQLTSELINTGMLAASEMTT